MVVVQLVTYVLLPSLSVVMEGVRDELKSVTIMNGEQCVIMDGAIMMLK